MNTMTQESTAQLQARIEVLEGILAEAYQLAGAIGAPRRVLDNLAAAVDGEPLPHGTFLPIQAEECSEVADRDRRLERVKQAVTT